jgi:hypothetical protein
MRREQMALDLPVPPRPEPDFPTKARAKLTAALATAKAAVDQSPWEHRKHRYWEIVFPQMAGWLPEAEREALVAEFRVEWERIDRMFKANEGETR